MKDQCSTTHADVHENVSCAQLEIMHLHSHHIVYHLKFI